MNIESNHLITIKKEYDYSNIFPSKNLINYLVKYLDNIYNGWLSFINKENKYQKNYQMQFKITINEKNNLNSYTILNYDSFLGAINNGYLDNISSLIIDLNLSYNLLNGKNIEEYQNDYKIVFKPYDIKFYRLANHYEDNMNKYEDNIKMIFAKFPHQDSIFCTKGNE